MQLDMRNRKTIFASLPKGGVGAEIGVGWGTFSKELLCLAEPSLLYLIDNWVQQPFEVVGDAADNMGQESKDSQHYQLLGWFLTEPRVRVIKAFSLATAPLFPDNYFDWLYIDANHLQAYQDCVAWWPKVRPAGVLIGDDYIDRGNCFTVKTDVDRFVAEGGHKLQVAVDADTEYKNYAIQKI